MTPPEHALLSILLKKPKQTKTYEQLIDVLFGDDPNGGPLNAKGAVVDHIGRLKVKMSTTAWRLVNVPGVGYYAERRHHKGGYNGVRS